MDQRFNKLSDQKINYKTKTILACPILDGEKCLGVLECINKNDGVFTKEDEQLIKMLAKLSAAILSNAINLNEQNLQYNKLRHIINVLK